MREPGIPRAAAARRPATRVILAEHRAMFGISGGPSYASALAEVSRRIRWLTVRKAVRARSACPAQSGAAMIAASQPTASFSGERGHSRDAARPPWWDRHYLYPHAWQPAEQPPDPAHRRMSAHGPPPGCSPPPRPPATGLLAPAAPALHDLASAHAVIGNQLLMPDRTVRIRQLYLAIRRPGSPGRIRHQIPRTHSRLAPGCARVARLPDVSTARSDTPDQPGVRAAVPRRFARPKCTDFRGAKRGANVGRR